MGAKDEPERRLAVSEVVAVGLACEPLERITITPDVRFGKPCVRGTRISVGDILP